MYNTTIIIRIHFVVKLFQQNSHPPPSKQDSKPIQETIDLKEDDYKQEEFVLMWDKKKCQPNTCKEFVKFWLGPYKIQKMSVNDSYYISTLDGRRFPLPISRSLLISHHVEET
jgi:hypothetical protein